MKLVKNALEVNGRNGSDLSDCFYVSEHVQVLFNGRRHFIEVCEFHPAHDGNVFFNNKPVFLVELGETPDRPQVNQLELCSIKWIDQALFWTLDDALRCVKDTLG